MARKDQEETKGFVIVSETKGVYLGGGRWSSADHGVTKAPVFSGEDEGALDIAKGNGGKGNTTVEKVPDAKYVEVTDHCEGGFITRDKLADAGVKWDVETPAAESSEETHGRRRRKHATE